MSAVQTKIRGCHGAVVAQRNRTIVVFSALEGSITAGSNAHSRSADSQFTNLGAVCEKTVWAVYVSGILRIVAVRT